MYKGTASAPSAASLHVFVILYRYLFYYKLSPPQANPLDHLLVPIVLLSLSFYIFYELVVSISYSRTEASPGPVFYYSGPNLMSKRTVGVSSASFNNY